MHLDFQGPIEIPFRKFEEAWLDIPVFRIFKEVTRRNPDKIALKCGEQQFNYQETYNRATTIAHALKAYNTHQEPVGIALPNDVFFPIAMLASLAAGCPYVPLDIDLPMARNQLIIEQSGIRSIITTTDAVTFAEGLTIITIDDLVFTENTPFDCEATPEDVAYIIYTSGSTGIPKGVYQNQRNLLHDVMQYTNSVHLSENDRLSLLYSPSVSGAIRDIYGALLNGGTLVIKNLKKTGLYDLARFINQEKITIYHSIPNIFRTFLKLNPVKSDFDSVRLIYLAGDRIYNTDVGLYKAFFPSNGLLYVGIGATEIATIYRQWFIHPHTLIRQELIPLGYAVADRAMRLLNEENNQVSDGEVGEIAIDSSFISLGYWNNPLQTAESFTINAHNPSVRTFRTSDLGRINSEGLLEFIGRKDKQVKINGYRVELSEIEGVLMNHANIERCGVVLYTHDRHNALFAFYTGDKEIPEVRLKNWLAERLPDYMIPQRCIYVEDIPLLHNFKNDNKALIALAEQYANKAPESGNPAIERNDFLYTVLRKTWCKFLNESSFDKNIRWKDAGGDSVNAVNFLVQLESDLGTTLPMDWIHGGMTPDEIYAYLNSLNIQEYTDKGQIIYFFPALSGITENTREFLKNLSSYAEVRIIHYPTYHEVHPDNRNLEYAIDFIIKQMPDSDSMHVGFLSICSGSLIMNRTITHLSPRNYSFVGVIEGREVSVTNPIYMGFFERVRSFIKKDDLVNGSIFWLYKHSEIFKKFIHQLERKKYYSIKNYPVLINFYPTTSPVYFDGEIAYFGCSQSMIDSNGNHWKPYCKKVNLVSIKGMHADMLNEENAQIIIATIRHIFGKPEVKAQ